MINRVHKYIKEEYFIEERLLGSKNWNMECNAYTYLGEALIRASLYSDNIKDMEIRVRSTRNGKTLGKFLGGKLLKKS